MDRSELAARLASAEPASQPALLAEHSDQADAALAHALKDLCYRAWASDPAQAVSAAAALEALAGHNPDTEIRALANWTAGIAALTQGQMEAAIERLDQAAAGFAARDQPHLAASTQVSKLMALAMLGRYDDALACGLAARDAFAHFGDELAAGKVEQNLGNIHFRRDQYSAAEALYRAARSRYNQLGDPQQQAQIDVCLAVSLVSQQRFSDAAKLYETALASAQAAGLEVTQAEIECNVGCLALFQGDYGRALHFLESSRRRYVALGQPHESAIAEQEMADAYLELNLAPEALAIYQRIIPVYADLGLRAEQARAQLNAGRAHLQLGEDEAARAALQKARALYAAEGNVVGEAVVTLSEAQRIYAAAQYGSAAEHAAQAEGPLAEVGAWGRLLMARWLRGEATRALGRASEARALLEATLTDALQQAAPQIAQRCLTSLGLLAAAAGDPAAESLLERAVAIIEDLRAPLPAEEFRTAFVADKLVPYVELARLCLAQGRIAEALGCIERARSRALVDMLGGALQMPAQPGDEFEAELWARLDRLREELNWFYTQMNRRPDDHTTRGAALESLNAGAREREAAVQEIGLQLRHSSRPFVRVAPLDLHALQSELGEHSALVEYFSLDGALLAFVVTGDGVTVHDGLGSEAQVQAVLGQLRFQMDALRHSPARVARHLDQLAARARRHLAALHAQLLAPLEGAVGRRRLVVAPHRGLHYVPFHALHDGSAYVIESREVVYAPSASVLRHCLALPQRDLTRALLVGVADESIPRVRAEVLAVAPMFANAVTLLDDQATVAAVRAGAPAAGVLHLASHGQFRPDNPLFSAVRLADGWLTVRDAYGLDLRQCGLVVLSACETGVSAVAPGDDLIGLARGFISAGAPALVVSLWTVDDETTARLMRQFYERLRAGDSRAAALRFAQRRLLESQPHPFYWSPFTLVGRW